MAKKQLSEGQEVMVSDGLPEQFAMTEEERAEIRKNNPPKKKELAPSLVEENTPSLKENTPDLVDKKKLPTKKALKQIADRAEGASWEKVSEYNKLSDEATALGLDGYKRATGFVSDEQAEARIKTATSAIKAHKTGQQEADQQEAKEYDVRKTSTKAKAKAAPQAASKVKSTARRAINSNSNGVIGREGSLKHQAYSMLGEKRGKPVTILSMAKKLYGKNATVANSRSKIVGGVLLVKGKMPNGVSFEGKGEEETVKFS